MTLLEAVRLIKAPAEYGMSVEYGGMNGGLTAEALAGKEKTMNWLQKHEMLVSIIVSIITTLVASAILKQRGWL